MIQVISNEVYEIIIKVSILKRSDKDEGNYTTKHNTNFM